MQIKYVHFLAHAVCLPEKHNSNGVLQVAFSGPVLYACSEVGSDIIKLWIFSLLSVLGAQKNRLIETVLMRTHNIHFGYLG